MQSIHSGSPGAQDTYFTGVPPSGWNHRLHTLEDHRVGGGAGEEGAISEASLQEAAAFSPSSHATCSNTALGGLCPQDQSEDMLKQTNKQTKT